MRCAGVRYLPAGGRVRRLLSGCLAALIALVGTISLTVGIAEAAAPASVTALTSSPANPTTSDGTSPTTLAWAFTATDGAFCELVRDDEVVDPRAACTSTVTYPVTTFGAYTFELFSAAADDQPTVSSSVTVAPPAPQVTVRGLPAPPLSTALAIPQWSFALLPGAAATCSVTDAAGEAVVPASTCASPYSGLVGTPAGTAPGRYTLSVSQSVAGVGGPSATSSFVVRARVVHRATARPTVTPAVRLQSPLDLVEPGTPTLTADAASGASPYPTFTVVVDAGAIPECSVSDPAEATVTTCADTTTLDLSNAPPGTYTLTVDATNLSGTSSPATADYDYEPDPPAAPVVVAQAGPGIDRTPTFTVTDPDDTGSNLTYHCTVAGPATVTVADSACGASTTPKLKGDPDGTYTLSVTATDGSGLTSAAGSDSYTLDTTTPAPTVTQTSPAAAVAASPTVTYDISSTETPDGPDTFSCTWTDPSAVSTMAPCPADGTFTASSGNGTYTLAVTGTDSLGNANTTTVPYTYDDATGVPAVTLTGAQVTPSAAATATYKITATELLDGPDAFSCDWVGPGQQDPGPSACASPATFAAPIDGDYTLTVVATDLIGNQQTTVVTYRRDSSTPPPAVALIGPEQTPSGLAAPSFTITDAETLDGPDTLTCEWVSPKGVDSNPLPCGSNYTYDVSKLGTGRVGTYTLTVTATDGAGNTSSSIFSYTFDNATPAPVVALVGGASPSSSTSVAYAVSDTEALDGPDSLSCDWVDPSGGDSGATDCSGGSFSTTANAGDGTYTLTVAATDLLGNTKSTVVTYKLDTSTPVPVVAFAGGQTSPSRVVAPGFVISDAEGLDGPDSFTCLWVAPDGTTISNAACSTAPSLSTAGYTDGVFQLTVTATDGAGNTATASPLRYTYDSSTPAPVVTLLHPTSTPSNVSNPTFTITDAEPGDDFSCEWTAPGAPAVGADSCATGQAFATAGDGSYQLDVTATDSAGNEAETSVPYVLDTIAPGQPTMKLASAVRASQGKVLWVWGYDFNDPDPSYTSTCQVHGPNWTYSVSPCPRPLYLQLTGDYGTYRARVVLADAAGNTSSSPWSKYIWDPRAPAGPLVQLLTHPSTGASTDRNPEWSVTAPHGSTLICTLRRGGRQGTPIIGPETCPQPTTYDLSGRSDGLFTLEVISSDRSGNPSYPAWSSYIVVPSAPTVIPPTDQNPSAKWRVEGNPQDAFDCTLSYGGATVNERPCSDAPTYDMTNRPTGKYTLSVIQIGARKVKSQPGTASYNWAGGSDQVPPGGTKDPGATGSEPPHHKPPSGPSRASVYPPSPVHPSKGLGGVLGTFVPPPLRSVPKTVDRVGKTVHNIVSGISSAGGGTGFPLLLLGFVAIFILVQNRIDRRDPKLALASITADDLVEFQPPPSRRDRP